MAIKQHIPNSITACNLISGCIAITFALSGNMEKAMLWIVIGAVFDFFDGMVARLLGVSSPIGKELDSLADVVTFGVAPAAMIFHIINISPLPAFAEGLRNILPYSAFLLPAFSALRLAKFNLDERQATGFIGLPTPANALFWSSLIVGTSLATQSNTLWTIPLILIGILLCSWLMVAEIPMFALKFKQWGWRENEVKYVFLISCLFLLAIFGISAFAIIILWYVVLSFVVRKKTEKKS
ncbi:MAG: CDP-diacylglycerol--serine O-phosphatidyltransferase [Prevotella sp.]|nr:CDP-diacylglycerol--serine O-phosphatidyltransferase [Prevotella sp.]MDD7273846.1 CDP-diacylglycerol--serine O-phosphatidyltransferase [Prevotellaceae bacterium]MDY3936026.1 CDP-diacylglycerol--serine O-phosphatidyltransferase [Prevotella sp.]MDY4218516.1 CDP-diacylglycerol--serine O-phosphatidyltransferase [Prevotella sp.]